MNDLRKQAMKATLEAKFLRERREKLKQSFFTYWIPFTPKDCILKNFKCSKCGGIANNPYPYCPWCGRPVLENWKGIDEEEENV